MMFELPHPDVELPPGDEPLVLVASSTERDPEQRARRGRARGAGGRAGARRRRAQPPRGELAGRGSRQRPRPRLGLLLAADPGASAVVCHGGHGTISRALAAGVPVIVSPRAGRHGGERRPGRVVRRRADAAPAPARRAGARRGGSAACSRDPGFAARARRDRGVGARQRRRRSRARGSSSELARARGVSGRPRVLVAAVGLAGHALPGDRARARARRRAAPTSVVATSERWRGLLGELGLAAAPRSADFAVPGDGSTPARTPTLAESVRGLLPIAARSSSPTSSSATGSPRRRRSPPRSRASRARPSFPRSIPSTGRAFRPFALGAACRRATPLGAAAWSARSRRCARRLPAPAARVARGLQRASARSWGSSPSPASTGTLSDELDPGRRRFPQLEYPRRWPAHVHVTGPMMLDPSGRRGRASRPATSRSSSSPRARSRTWSAASSGRRSRRSPTSRCACS